MHHCIDTYHLRHEGVKRKCEDPKIVIVVYKHKKILREKLKINRIKKKNKQMKQVMTTTINSDNKKKETKEIKLK